MSLYLYLIRKNLVRSYKNDYDLYIDNTLKPL